jgi:hypothetical protein
LGGREFDLRQSGRSGRRKIVGVGPSAGDGDIDARSRRSGRFWSNPGRGRGRWEGIGIIITVITADSRGGEEVVDLLVSGAHVLVSGEQLPPPFLGGLGVSAGQDARIRHAGNHARPRERQKGDREKRQHIGKKKRRTDWGADGDGQMCFEQPVTAASREKPRWWWRRTRAGETQALRYQREMKH